MIMIGWKSVKAIFKSDFKIWLKQVHLTYCLSILSDLGHTGSGPLDFEQMFIINFYEHESKNPESVIEEFQ